MSLLVVGGAHAGERHEITRISIRPGEPGARIRLPIRPKVSVVDFDAAVGPEVLTAHYADYEWHRFTTQTGHVEVLAPVGQSPLQTLELLVETYAAALKE